MRLRSFSVSILYSGGDPRCLVSESQVSEPRPPAHTHVPATCKKRSPWPQASLQMRLQPQSQNQEPRQPPIPDSPKPCEKGLC